MELNKIIKNVKKYVLFVKTIKELEEKVEMFFKTGEGERYKQMQKRIDSSLEDYNESCRRLAVIKKERDELYYKLNGDETKDCKETRFHECLKLSINDIDPNFESWMCIDVEKDGNYYYLSVRKDYETVDQDSIKGFYIDD